MQRIRRFDPVQVAKVMGVLYGLIGLIIAPFLLLVSFLAPPETGRVFGVGFAIAIPLVYGAMGALAMLIAAALYNLVAGWVGGIDVELE